PDGKSILYSSAKAGWNREGGSRPETFFGISSVSLESRRETQLLPHVEEKTTFQFVGRPSMTHGGDILFTGIAPYKGAFNDRVERLDLPSIQDLALRLRP